MESYRFSFKEEAAWRNCLKEQGFAVITDWLSREECDHYVQKFWDIMEILADGTLDRKDKETQILSKNYPPVLHGGMIQYVGHSQIQWDLRKKTRPIF